MKVTKNTKSAGAKDAPADKKNGIKGTTLHVTGTAPTKKEIADLKAKVKKGTVVAVLPPNATKAEIEAAKPQATKRTPAPKKAASIFAGLTKFADLEAILKSNDIVYKRGGVSQPVVEFKKLKAYEGRDQFEFFVEDKDAKDGRKRHAAMVDKASGYIGVA